MRPSGCSAIAAAIGLVWIVGRILYALGYVADAKRVDTKRFPKFVAGQNCTNCSLYQGKATDAAAGCPIFAGKQVAGKGWCSAWAKKG